MDCHRIAGAWCPIALVFWLSFLPAIVRSAENEQPAAVAPSQVLPISATTRAMRNDAALADVCFISPTLGWTVGDRGVIWHTDDGGQTWRQQQSNVECHLNAVFFIDGERGWAVGGQCRPQQACSRGVVLRTVDGGATWNAIPQLVLPRLNGVKFFDPNHGVAFGDCAAIQPSGVFTTRDAGATWQPLATDSAGDWLAGDVLDQDIGAFGGPAGQIATLARHQLAHSPLATTSLRSFRAMRLIAPTGGWAVGDGGLVLTTHDVGRSWQTPPTDLPQYAADHFDFRAVAVQSPHVWLAGSPGTRIFHSPDDGQTWESFTTGQTTPLRALTFVDAQHGWAVGDFSNILATHDGGRTWQSQHSGGQRAALLALFAKPTDVPLELFADSGVADGYLAAVDILCAFGSDAPGGASHAAHERWQESILLSGAATATTSWRFPLPAADLALAPADILERLNRENDGRAIHQLQSQLVRELRMWRPDVIVTHHDRMEMSEPMAALVEQLVAQAVSAAADPVQNGALASDVGLPPWQVKKVYGVLPAGSRGDEMLATGRFSPSLGAPLSDFVAPARRLLYSEHTPPPDSYELKLLFSAGVDGSNARGIFGGIALAPGSDARRQQTELPTQDLESLRQLATRRRHLQELMERTEGNAAWAGQISNMVDGLSTADGGQLLVELADGYRRAGHLDLAADTYFLFARRFPDHPLVEPSLDWLVKFYASSETAHRLKTALGMPALADGRNRQASLDDNNAVRQASAVSPISAAPPASFLSRDDRLRRAVQLANYLQTARPALYAEPGVRFAETAAQRELGYANPAQRFFLSLRQLPESDPWRECATTEEWLAQPADVPPAKKIGACRPADQRPHLDGKLDEPFWGKADHLRLVGDSVERTPLPAPKDAETDKIVRPPSAEVQLAYDNEFLYIAIHCPKQPNLDYASDAAPRPRDSDLVEHDRVSLSLDIDRDYGTAFELTVDSRGWTRDACWGDVTWNPTWYVAAASDDATWTVEAAIPLAEIVDKAPTVRQVWAVAARRTIPRVGYECWSGPPALSDSPARFGLLIFE